MLKLETLEHFFKPEVRKQGTDAFSKGAVTLSQAADTAISSYVKGSSPIRVSFTTDSIASETFTVDCSCPPSSRGQLCKHIWATLLQVEKSFPDFLDSKTEIVKGNNLQKAKQASTVSPAQAEARAATQAAFKEKQADYRKQQYQKQKQRLKDQKQAQKEGGKATAKPFSSYVSFPEPVVQALAYFSDNGFPMEHPIEEEDLRTAKKVLSRVFHPDKGGTHEEILALNRNFEIVLDYLQS